MALSLRITRQSTVAQLMVLASSACSSQGATVGPNYNLTGGMTAAHVGGSAPKGDSATSGRFPAAGGGAATGGAGSSAQIGGSSSAQSLAGSTATGGTSEAGAGAGGPAGGSNAGRSTAKPSRPLISELAIDPNPNSTLSCFVSWKTDIAASSEVEFGADQYQFRIVHDEPTTEHRVLVIGMRASTKYLIRAVSANAGGAAKVEGEFTTGPLPDGLPLATLTTSDPSASQRGWTLMNTMPLGSSRGFQGTEPGIIVMYDEEGVPVWYYVNGNTPDQRGDVSIQILPNDNILLGPSSGEPAKEIDLAGNVVWQGPPQPSDPNASPMSHHAGKLENGNYLLLRDNTVNGIRGALVEEVTSENRVVWSWNLFDHLQPGQEARSDWCHPNSVAVDLSKDVFYLSCRWLGVIKAKRSGDGAILWVLGGKDGGDFRFSPEASSFDDQHDPDFHDDGTVLVYNKAGESMWGQFQSRVLEFSLDEENRMATAVFQFPGEFSVDEWFTSSWATPYWGDADRLANGNVLITIGYRMESRATRVVEVRSVDGKVVWEIVLPFFVGSYQAERWSPPPLVTR